MEAATEPRTSVDDVGTVVTVHCEDGDTEPRTKVELVGTVVTVHWVEAATEPMTRLPELKTAVTVAWLLGIVVIEPIIPVLDEIDPTVTVV